MFVWFGWAGCNVLCWGRGGGGGCVLPRVGCTTDVCICPLATDAQVDVEVAWICWLWWSGWFPKEIGVGGVGICLVVRVAVESA